jgi:Phosphoesterase family
MYRGKPDSRPKKIAAFLARMLISFTCVLINLILRPMPSSIYAGKKTILPFDHIFVIMLENATRGEELNNVYMRTLCNKSVFLKNSYGVTHSSQPNYIVSVEGDNFGISDVTATYVQWVYESPAIDPNNPVTSIVDLLEAKNFTWKAYAEDLPSTYVSQAAASLKTQQQPPYVIPADVGNFDRKHVPFLSFPNIMIDPKRYVNIVEAAQLDIDLLAGNLPNFSWYTPNMIHDGHNLKPGQGSGSPDTNRHLQIENIAGFLPGFWGTDPLSKFPPKTLIVLTFDEAYPYSDPYEIYTLLLGDALHTPGTRSEPYNHYSLLRSIEVNFGLDSLQRNDAVANPYWFLNSD